MRPWRNKSSKKPRKKLSTLILSDLLLLGMVAFHGHTSHWSKELCPCGNGEN